MAMRPQRAKIKPKEEAKYFASLGKDKDGFEVQFINSYKGRGVFSRHYFQKGEFLIEYRGEIISKKEHENRLRLYHDALKVFMFEFRHDGKKLCIDAAKEDNSLGRLVNDDHISPNSKMKTIAVTGIPHLCLFALKDIKPGEEITYNYGDSDWPWRLKSSPEKERLCSEVLVNLRADNATQMTATEADCQNSAVAMTSDCLRQDEQVSGATVLNHAAGTLTSDSSCENTEQTATEADCQNSAVAMTSDCLRQDEQVSGATVLNHAAGTLTSDSSCENTEQTATEADCQNSAVAMTSDCLRQDEQVSGATVLNHAAGTLTSDSSCENTEQTATEADCQNSAVAMTSDCLRQDEQVSGATVLNHAAGTLTSDSSCENTEQEWRELHSLLVDLQMPQMTTLAKKGHLKITR
ncbi:uncharacterized protein LOC118469710 [Amphiprion ocellaris]|uniref:uncharacterized protein LOC118469710 n=1 Tax=Amphiprion ocellaris TaxID=80972 RepID=UPI0024115B4A|nr:uncharacterized protein LOC118469710 [Amphiprion ocellaris]